MSFSALSTELVLMLAECMENSQLNMLARTCWTLYRLLNPCLYHRDWKSGRCDSLIYALLEMNVSTAKHFLAFGASTINVAIMVPKGKIRELSRPFWRDKARPLTFGITQWSRRNKLRLCRRPLPPERPVRDCVSMIRLLLDRGAELSQDDAENLLVIAGRQRPIEGDLEPVEARQELVELARLVCRYWRYPDGKSVPCVKRVRRVLGMAASGGSVEILQLLLDHGYPANVERARSLYFSALQDNVAAARLLLERGAYVDERDHCGQTALHTVLTSNCRGKPGPSVMVRLLVEHGANLSEGFDSPNPLLLTAIGCEDDNLISYLASSGADFVSLDSHGNTLLHKAGAVPGGTHGILKLAELGVNPHAINNQGNTALHCAAAHAHSLAQIEALLHLSSNVNLVNNEGNTALHIVASNPQIPKRAEMLVKAGAEIDARRSSDGSTALHLAARRKDRDLVRLLLSLGANANVQDTAGKTPLDVVLEFQQRDRPKMIERWLRAKRGNRGETSDDDSVGGRRSKQARLQQSRVPDQRV